MLRIIFFYYYYSFINLKFHLNYICTFGNTCRESERGSTTLGRKEDKNNSSNSNNNSYIIKQIIEVPEASSNSNSEESIMNEEKSMNNYYNSSKKESREKVAVGGAIKMGSRDEEEEEKEIIAMKAIEEQLREQRSWINNNNNGAAGKCGGGRGIYVYELPAKFNKELVGQCGEMVPWMNFCKYFNNEGLGEKIPELGDGWYNTNQYALEPIFHSRYPDYFFIFLLYIPINPLNLIANYIYN